MSSFVYILKQLLFMKFDLGEVSFRPVYIVFLCFVLAILRIMGVGKSGSNDK